METNGTDQTPAAPQLHTYRAMRPGWCVLTEAPHFPYSHRTGPAFGACYVVQMDDRTVTLFLIANGNRYTVTREAFDALEAHPTSVADNFEWLRRHPLTREAFTMPVTFEQAVERLLSLNPADAAEVRL